MISIPGVVLTPDNPLFSPTGKEESDVIGGPVSEAHSKGFESKSLLVEIGKGSTVTVTIPNIFIKETDYTLAFLLRGKNVNVGCAFW